MNKLIKGKVKGSKTVWAPNLDCIAFSDVKGEEHIDNIERLLKKAGFIKVGEKETLSGFSRVLIFSTGHYQISSIRGINSCYSTEFKNPYEMGRLVSFFRRYGFHDMKDSVIL